MQETTTIKRETISISIELPLLNAIENIAQNEQISVQATLEKALRNFVEQTNSQSVRQNVMEHFNASLSKNHRLGELLAK
jgi:metal-responsive CopG/Arc/MetJ family transcriptional regulator